MRVYLCRHTHAVDEGPRLDDDARFLTAKGRQVARAVGIKLRAQGVDLDAVLTSPLVRAVQTAELMAGALDFIGIVEAVPPLAPGVPPRIVAEELASRGQSLLVVGHEPSISALGAFLVSRPSFPPFRKGQVSLVEDGRPGWWLDPDTLRVEPLLVA